MMDITVNSWSELQDQLFADSWNPSISRFRSPFVFRGLADKNYPLLSSLMRLGGPYDKLELNLLRNFRKYGHEAHGQMPSLWHLMALAQHHGLPTRLLDWTVSPYVAIHFATAELGSYEEDGVVWMVNSRECNTLLPEELKDRLGTGNAAVVTIEMLAAALDRSADSDVQNGTRDILDSLVDFDALGQQIPFLLFFEPPSIDGRIVNQYALFSVMPGARLRTDEWLVATHETYRRIIIPAELKWECRDKLDMSGITERVLFPGLDGLAKWLSRYYGPGSQPPSQTQESP